MSNLSSFLSEFDYPLSKQKAKNIKPENVKLMNDVLEKYLYSVKRRCYLIKDMNLPDSFFESPNAAAILIYNHIFNEMPSVDNVSFKYTTALLDHLYDNGELIYVTVWDYMNNDGGYDLTPYFLYKGSVVCARLTASAEEGVSVHSLLIAYSSTAVSLRKELAAFTLVKKKEPAIGIIKQRHTGLYVHRFDITSKTVFDFSNYNDDFPEFWEALNKKLVDQTSGLYLFHGDPGTGKSSAIRYLLSQCERDFIFVPPQMVHHLATPEFSDLLTGSAKGAVLIIEDAEKALIKRETEDGFSNSTLVSSILNITDGLYADLTNISIIATYNCDRNLIDPALLRKGRMKAEYQFKKLTTEKAQAIMDKLGHNVDVTEEMSLADIYNYKDQYSNNVEGHKPKRIAGFSK